MYNYSTPTTVNSQEAEALKEMIFNRVRSRAEALNKETQESYVDNVQIELMDLARASFRSTKNPFMGSNTPVEEKTSKLEETEEVYVEKAESKTYEGIGFAQTRNDYVYSQIKLKTNISNESLAKDAVMSTMSDARQSLENKSSFMGALNFLNSQASIAIVNKTGKHFEANA